MTDRTYAHSTHLLFVSFPSSPRRTTFELGAGRKKLMKVVDLKTKEEGNLGFWPQQVEFFLISKFGPIKIKCV